MLGAVVTALNAISRKLQSEFPEWQTVIEGGGGVIFRIHWQHPLALAALALGYACFAAGFMATLVALLVLLAFGAAANLLAARFFRS